MSFVRATTGMIYSVASLAGRRMYMNGRGRANGLVPTWDEAGV